MALLRQVSYSRHLTHFARRREAVAKTSTAKKTTKKKTTKAAKPASPSIDVPALDPSQQDLLAGLVGDLEASPQLAAAKGNKWTPALTKAQKAQVERLAAVRTAKKVIEAMDESDSKALQRSLFPDYVKHWFKSSHKPDNPRLVTDDAQIILQVKAVIRANDQAEIKAALEKRGLDKAKAEEFSRFVEKKTSTVFSKSLQALQEGSAEEKTVSTKLLKLIAENFNVEERKLLLVNEVKVSVNAAGLFGSLAKCETEKEMMDVLEVLKPDMAFSQESHKNAMAQLGKRLSLTGEGENGGKIDYESKDGLHKAIVDENRVHLMERPDKKHKFVLVGTKECAGGADHARAWAEKVTTEPAELSAALEEINA